MGFKGYSKARGDYRVTEARQFRRHDFEELEQHPRNFLGMGVESISGQGKIMDLRYVDHSPARTTVRCPRRGDV